MALLQFLNKVGDDLEQGDVVIIARRQPNARTTMGQAAIEVDLAQRAYDASVCGVVLDLYVEHKPEDAPAPEAGPKEDKRSSGRKGAQAKSAESRSFAIDELERLDRSTIPPGRVGHLVASGVCGACKVDADIAPIKPGDLLTTSATKGHAQKAVDLGKAAGSILGKALGSLDKGKGAIPVLVTLL